MDCLDDPTLDRLVAGRLDANELALVDVHLDECPGCRGRLAERARRSEAGVVRVLPLELEPAPDPYVGRLIAGRYQILKRIGGGGMGSVYEAEHALIGRRVAIKILHPQFGSNREVVRRFQNEARAAGTLGHPGILQALDMGRSEDGMPFLVLELLEGRDLDQEIVALGTLPIDRAVNVALRIADALSAAHAAGIVHRDLKPENVFVLRDGSLKVLDFGISKIASSLVTGPLTAPGALMGTPAYMAPEQFEDAARASPRSDIYALGAILYRSLTGTLPFEASSLPKLLLAIMTTPAPSPRARRPEIPEGLDAIVQRAMATDPDARFQTMDEIAEALRPFAATTSGRPRSVPPPERTDELRVATVLAAIGVKDGATSGLALAVEREGGRLVASADGTAVALFGERTWTGDEAERAVRVALALRPVADAIAVCTGRVGREGGVVGGEAVERAIEACHARLSGVAVVHPTTRIESGFVLRRVTDELSEVTAEAGGSWSILPAALTESQPLLGRDAEVAQVRAALEHAASAREPAVLYVTGASGMGKTRLAAEAIRLAETLLPDAAVLVGAARALGAEQRGLLAAAIGGRARWAAWTLGWPRIDPGAPMEERRAAVSRLASEAADGPEGAALGEFLGELLGVPMPASSAISAARASPRLMADRLTLTLRDYLDGLTSRQPVVMVLEDLQWADAASLQLLEQIVTDVAWERPLVVIGTARPELLEHAPVCFGGPEANEVRLRGLAPADVQTMASWLVGAEIDDSLARALVERTGGNPFFLEQTLRALHDEGRLEANAGAESLPLPVDVEAAVQARLDALPDDQREAIKRAAVLGTAFTASDLAAVGVVGADAALEGLARAGLVRRRGGRDRPEPSYELRTSLLADVAYRLLGEDARRALHLQAARVLSARSGTDSELGALHLDRGGAREEAARAYHAAALVAARKLDSRRVLRCAERALALGAPDDALFSLHVLRADALEVEGRLEEQRVAIDAALHVAQTPEERATALEASGFWTMRTRGPDASLPEFEQAVAAATVSGEPVALARALGRLAAALAYVGRLDEAAGTLGEAERWVSTRAPGLRADAAVWRAQLAGAQGDLGARRSAYQVAVELYRTLGDARAEAGASVNLADADNRFGAHAEAERALVAALESCRRLGMRLMEGYALANLGYARTKLGKLREAREDLDDALRVGEATGDARLSLFATLYRASWALAAGDGAAAIVDAHAVVAAADALGLRPAGALARIIVARALLSVGDTVGALAESSGAMQIRQELGGLEEDEGELYLVHATALAAAGRLADAEVVRQEGRRLVMATAQRIADPEWRRRLLADIPAHRELLSSA